MLVLIEVIKVFDIVLKIMNSMKRTGQLILLLFVLLIMVPIGCVFSACTSKHYFSVNADVMENPSILYSDSTEVTNPF